MRAPLRLIAFLSMLLAVPVYGNEAGKGCDRWFGALTNAMAKPTLEDLEKLNATKVRSIFKGTTQRTTLTGQKETVVRITNENRKALYDHFNNYINAQRAAGELSRDEANSFRRWLSEKHRNKLPYPDPDAKMLYEHFHQQNSTLGEYYDILFTNYVYEKHGLTAESMADYFSRLRPSQLRRLYNNLDSWSRAVQSSTWQFAKIGAPVALAVAVLDGMGYSAARSWISSKVQETRDWMLDQSSMQLQQALADKEDLTRSMDFIVSRLERWKPINYNSVSRVHTKNDFDYMVENLRPRIAAFRTFIREPDFDAKERERLRQVVSDLKLNQYDQVNDRLSALKKEIETRKDRTPTEEQQKRLDALNADLETQENELARLLSSWMFYRSTLEPGQNLEAEVDEPMQNAYRKYLENNNLNKLRDAYISRLEPLIATLQKNSGIRASARPTPRELNTDSP